MSLHRRAAQRDANEGDIVRAFERCGWLVQRHTAWDLDVCCPQRAHIVAVEVKAPKGRLTESQHNLVRTGWPLEIVRSVEDVLEVVRAHRLAVHAKPIGPLAT